jgi:hypothetical protein
MGTDWCFVGQWCPRIIASVWPPKLAQEIAVRAMEDLNRSIPLRCLLNALVMIIQRSLVPIGVIGRKGKGDYEHQGVS